MVHEFKAKNMLHEFKKNVSGVSLYEKIPRGALFTDLKDFISGGSAEFNIFAVHIAIENFVSQLPPVFAILGILL